MKKLKKIFKCGILLFGGSIMLFNCQKEDDIFETNNFQTKSYKTVSLNQVPKLIPIINNIKNVKQKKQNANKQEFIGLENILVDQIIQTIDANNNSNYTLGIANDFKTTGYLENLHLIETGEDYISYIIRYIPNSNWSSNPGNYTPEGDLVLNPSTFKGDIIKYTLDREVIWTTIPQQNSRGTWIEVCTISLVQYCSNDGSGGPDGAPHESGPNCNGPFYAGEQESCTTVYASGGVGTGDNNDNNPDGNDDGVNNGGGYQYNEGCEEVIGTLIQNTQPISGMDTGCTTNTETGFIQIDSSIIEDDCDTSKEDISKVFPNISDSNASILASIINDRGQDFGIDSDEDLWHFLAQAGHETGGFNSLNVTESTYWSTASKLAVTYSKFTMDSNLAATNNNKYYAPDYLYNSSGVANIAMCCQYGNGNIESGDGYKYRGRGIFQLTWKDNYTKFRAWYNSKYTPIIDPVSTPDIISTNDTLAILSGLWYYKTRVVDKITIDSNTTVKAVTKQINTARKGLFDRKERFQKAKDSINCL